MRNPSRWKLPHELFLTTRQTAKIRDVFANNMPTNIKLSKPQISKIIQSDGSFGSWLGYLDRNALKISTKHLLFLWLEII